MNAGELMISDADRWIFTIRGTTPIEIFMRPDDPSASARTLDCAVVASVLYWMSQPIETVRVRGAMSATLLMNISELQQCWARWRPADYSPVEFVPDDIIHDAPRNTGAIAAFSGGVDATFTLLTSTRAATSAGPELRAVMMVQGFDIGLDEPDVFERALIHGRVIADHVDMPIRVVRTNIKEALPVRWEDSFGLSIAAALLTHQHQHRYGLIGSSYPYDALVLPLGSSPVQDWMASTGSMEVRHHGAGYSRIEKIEHIAGFPAAVKHLRVCWSGPHHDRNCGHCEKCVRTMLGFKAIERPVPPCFPLDVDPRCVQALRVPTLHKLQEYERILAECRRRRIRAPWVSATRQMIARERVRLRVRGSWLKRPAKALHRRRSRRA